MSSMNPATAPSTGLARWRYVRTGGSALFTAWRTSRRWTPNFRATPLIVPIPNSYSRRNCSNSSTFVLLSTPPLPLVQRKDGTPRQKGGPNSVSKVGRHPIANSPDQLIALGIIDQGRQSDHLQRSHGQYRLMGDAGHCSNQTLSKKAIICHRTWVRWSHPAHSSASTPKPRMSLTNSVQSPA